jgi:diguanylate cyclase (GGDEF)-like protein
MEPNPNSIVSDRRRLQAVSELDFESSGRHQALDDLAELVAEVLDVPTVLVSIVDRDVQRMPGAAGLPEPLATTRELPLASSLCTTVVESSTALVIYDAANDPRVAHHPSLRGLGVAAYLGVPIGQNDAGPLGTLCAIDERPRSWTPRDLRLLRSLAVAADTLLAARRGQHSSGSHDRVFRSFVGAVTHPIVIADAEGRVTHANDAARACLGRETVGDPWDPGPGSDIMQADGKTPYAHGEDPLARALRGEATRGERVRWAPSTAWFDVTALPVRDDAGQTIGAISFWHDVTGPHAMQEKLSALADGDELTGLRNRRSFLSTADEMLGLARRRRMRATLVVVDLDGLKPINDQHGHEGGDDAIRGLASVVSAALPEGAAVGRLSGDEIACLWVHPEPNAEASVRTRLISSLADYNRTPARRIRLAISVGAAVQGPDEVATLDELLRNADAARITEKRAKR